MPKKLVSDEPPKCPSCGVPFEDHLGLIGTCGKLEQLKRSLTVFVRVWGDLTEDHKKIINEMLEKSK